MMNRQIACICFALLFSIGASGQASATASPQVEDFDYFTANRTMVRNGVQAILMCNGLFTSGRTLEQVFTPQPNAESRGYKVGLGWRLDKDADGRTKYLDPAATHSCSPGSVASPPSATMEPSMVTVPLALMQAAPPPQPA